MNISLFEQHPDSSGGVSSQDDQGYAAYLQRWLPYDGKAVVIRDDEVVDHAEADQLGMLASRYRMNHGPTADVVLKVSLASREEFLAVQGIQMFFSSFLERGTSSS